jgi:hypothetical protein
MYSKPIDKEARLRHKLLSNEMNPFADAILSLVLFCVSPFIWMFALIHDKLMFKFLNKTYIYNVSWEVVQIRYLPYIILLMSLLVYPLGPTHGPSCFQS